MAASARDTIESLREEIRRIERRPPARARFTPSGVPEVDAVLPGGGFPRGALCELGGGAASGKTALALSTVAAATRGGGLAAYLDWRNELYPPAAAAFGVDLDRLLIVRPPAGGRGGDVRTALWAAEALFASGAFEAVVVDVPLPRGRVPGPAALDPMLRRLRAAAERGGSVALALAADGDARIPGALRVELSTSGGRTRARRVFGGELERHASPRGADHAA